MAGDSYPFDAAVAEDLVAQWQENRTHKKTMAIREIISRIAGTALVDPEEEDFALLGLSPFQILKRRAFVHHFRSAHVYVWKRVLMACMPSRVEGVMDGVFALLSTSSTEVAKRSRQTELDMRLYDALVDHFEEEGFMSVALHVVQRVLGDIEKYPHNIVVAVHFSGHLEQHYQRLREQLDLFSLP